MATSTLNIHRVNTLPGTPAPSSLYFVKSADSDKIDIYMTGTTGSEIRHVITKTEIQALISASMSGLNSIQIVADITARNALAAGLTANGLVLVLDATGDGTVTTGSALYAYRLSDTSWIKLSEFESLDVTLTWAALTNKPTSSVANIDDAVTKRHAHANLATLDKLSENVDGYLTYNANPIAPVLATTDW